MKKRAFLSIISFLTVACETAFLGEEEENNNTNVFEIFWNDLDKHYSLFTVRNIDWDMLYQAYRPQVNDDLSEDELWTMMSNLVEHLDDSHTTLYDGDKRYKSGYALNEQSIAGFDADLITSKYVEGATQVTTEGELYFGKVKGKEIGYIYLGSMNGNNPGVIDEVLQKLDSYQAIILDVRQNTGGDDRYSARIAQAFADGKHLIYTVQTRNGPGHDDFDEKKLYYTRNDNANPYTRPVVVLTDRRTISAGEIFLLHMKSFAHVTQIGDTTAGDFSTVSNMRFLPNGWTYVYSIQKFLLPNGTSLDGVGHVPAVYIKNTASDIDASVDSVLEGAFDYLYSAHGIE
ncbi:MAG: S41 family peptidase [Imperialibacter sp.]|uniref:S41 family peptidase n=1 Tax=Imperialibacter sp. TaxID=2038411 RepID=UPI0032EA9622